MIWAGCGWGMVVRGKCVFDLFIHNMQIILNEVVPRSRLYSLVYLHVLICNLWSYYVSL